MVNKVDWLTHLHVNIFFALNVLVEREHNISEYSWVYFILEKVLVHCIGNISKKNFSLNFFQPFQPLYHEAQFCVWYFSFNKWCILASFSFLFSRQLSFLPPEKNWQREWERGPKAPKHFARPAVWISTFWEARSEDTRSEKLYIY